MTDPFTEIVVHSFTVDEIHRLRCISAGSQLHLSVVDRVRQWTERRHDWDVRQQRADELVLRSEELLGRVDEAQQQLLEKMRRLEHPEQSE